MLTSTVFVALGFTVLLNSAAADDDGYTNILHIHRSTPPPHTTSRPPGLLPLPFHPRRDDNSSLVVDANAHDGRRHDPNLDIQPRPSSVERPIDWNNVGLKVDSDGGKGWGRGSHQRGTSGRNSAVSRGSGSSVRRSTEEWLRIFEAKEASKNRQSHVSASITESGFSAASSSAARGGGIFRTDVSARGSGAAKRTESGTTVTNQHAVNNNSPLAASEKELSSALAEWRDHQHYGGLATNSPPDDENWELPASDSDSISSGGSWEAYIAKNGGSDGGTLKTQLAWTAQILNSSIWILTDFADTSVDETAAVHRVVANHSSNDGGMIGRGDSDVMPARKKTLTLLKEWRQKRLPTRIGGGLGSKPTGSGMTDPAPLNWRAAGDYGKVIGGSHGSHSVSDTSIGTPGGGRPVSLHEACTKDSASLCANPNPHQVTMCLQLHVRKLSPKCMEYHSANVICLIQLRRLGICLGDSVQEMCIARNIKHPGLGPTCLNTEYTKYLINMVTKGGE